MKLKITISIIFILFSYLFLQFWGYKHNQNENLKKIQNDDVKFELKTHSKAAFELLIPKLLIYEAKKYDQDLEFAKLGYSPFWHPFINFKESKYFIHYLEPQKYDRAYDNEYYKFLIGDNLRLKTKTFQVSNNNKDKIQTDFFNFMNNIKEENQSAILLLNINELKGSFIEKLFNEYADNISGFNIYIEFNDYNKIKSCLDLLDKINKNFILVSRSSATKSLNKFSINTKYYKGEIYDSTLTLTYINKNKVHKYNISLEQNTNKIFIGKKVRFFRPTKEVPKSDIYWVITISEYIKNLIIKKEET